MVNREMEKKETVRKIRLTEPQIGEEEIEAVANVLLSGWLTEGEVTKRFEAKFASTVDARHGVAVCNCTVGLELALRALGVGKGDEVIVPDFTHPATALAVMWAGATPVLVDVNEFTYNAIMKEITKAVTERTKCVIPVSWGGYPLDPYSLRELKEKHNLAIIEDAACSLGAEYDGVKTGSMADITCFSLHPRKVITTGEGGMITTNNADLAEKLRSMKCFGEERTANGLSFKRLGTNYKMSNILAAIGLAQLEKLPKIIERRIELAENYNRLLQECMNVGSPAREAKAKHVYQTYAAHIEVDGVRDRAIKELRERGIEAQIGTYALHLEPAFKRLRHVGALYNSTYLYNNLIALPMGASMSFEDQKYVVSELGHIVGDASN